MNVYISILILGLKYMKILQISEIITSLDRWDLAWYVKVILILIHYFVKFRLNFSEICTYFRVTVDDRNGDGCDWIYEISFWGNLHTVEVHSNFQPVCFNYSSDRNTLLFQLAKANTLITYISISDEYARYIYNWQGTFPLCLPI